VRPEAASPGGALGRWLARHRRESLVALAYAALLVVVGVGAKGFFAPDNLRDLAVGVVPVLVAAVGMTMVIVARQIDISIGAQLAWGGVLAGTLAKAGLPMPLVALLVVVAGAAQGALNGVLVAWLRLPAIVVTLATMVIFRESLRWLTEGADIFGLPDAFQWLGLSQGAGRALLVTVALALVAAFAFGLGNLRAGRAVYAVGSDAETARLLGMRPLLVTFMVFVLMGALTGLAAFLGAVRFPQIQTNAGIGFELQVIAAVVVGGTAISGGRGTLAGTLIGVLFLGTIGTALTFLHVSAHWEKAIEGAIILAAVATDALELGRTRRGLAHAG
jgi:rhamnose transport system permease protein